jgi:phosphate uptake regulator
MNGLKIGSIIYISKGDNGTLTLSADRSEKNLGIKLDIGNKSGEHLARDIIACYIAGYKTIEIISSRMSASQKKDLHKIVNKLLGPEILEEANNKVLIQDLLDSEELQVEKALKRIKTLVASMIHDGMTALLTGDRDLASDVVQRDDDVDRLNLLVSRQFAGILRHGSVGKRNHSIIVALNYMQAASNLERIADHTLRIAEIAGEHSYSLPEEMADELLNLRSIFLGLIDESISALLQGDSDKANRIIDQAKEARMHSHNIANASKLKDKEALLVRLVAASSIERIIDYIINISELTINLRNSELETEERRLNQAPKICHRSGL